MMMFFYVSLQLNIFMMNEHTSAMKKNVFSTFILLFLLIPFIWAGFFDRSVFGIILLFFFYSFMIQQYYVLNHKKIEIKDLIFTLCFMIVSFLSYRLFQITLDYDQILILASCVFISIVNVGCNRRIQVEYS